MGAVEAARTAATCLPRLRKDPSLGTRLMSALHLTALILGSCHTGSQSANQSRQPSSVQPIRARLRHQVSSGKSCSCYTQQYAGHGSRNIFVRRQQEEEPSSVLTFSCCRYQRLKGLQVQKEKILHEILMEDLNIDVETAQTE